MCLTACELQTRTFEAFVPSHRCPLSIVGGCLTRPFSVASRLVVCTRSGQRFVRPPPGATAGCPTRGSDLTVGSPPDQGRSRVRTRHLCPCEPPLRALASVEPDASNDGGSCFNRRHASLSQSGVVALALLVQFLGNGDGGYAHTEDGRLKRFRKLTYGPLKSHPGDTKNKQLRS